MVFAVETTNLYFQEFVREASESGDANNNIIGQFGVGFYSAFMVGGHVTVMTKSAKPGTLLFQDIMLHN